MTLDFGTGRARTKAEVVLLPGAFGVNLADRSDDRLWLDPGQIAPSGLMTD